MKLAVAQGVAKQRWLGWCIAGGCVGNSGEESDGGDLINGLVTVAVTLWLEGSEEVLEMEE